MSLFMQSDAEWIWLPQEKDMVNQYADFRHEFTLNELEELSENEGLLHISVDTEYAVWLNGTFAGFNQYDDYPDHKSFDILDVKRLLVKGKNVLCILGYHQGENSYQYIKGRPGLIYAMRIGNKTIVSGTSSFTGWTVIGVLPYADIINRVQGIKFTFFLLAVIFVILVSVSSVLISRSVTKPMRDLQNAMKKVENGNTDIRVSIHNYNEVGALSHSFNQLIERINILLASIKKIEVRKREAEMDALNSQINPHFLYNTLESIRMMAVIEEKKEIAAATEALADLFRYSIKHRKDLVDIKDEIQHAVNFIRLLKIRYEDKFDFVVDMDNDIYQYKALKFILQPILENAIYHGIIKKPGKGVVKLSVHIEENNVVFNIWDDGIGMDAQKLCELREYLENVDMEDMKSIGLKNVNDRVRLYFGNSYGIAIDSSQGQWTRVKLAIPAFSNEEWVVNNVFGISCR